MTSYTMTIDGKAVAADKTFEVIDPATGEPFAEAPDANREQLDDAVAAARRALADWSRTPLDERRQVLQNIGAAIKPKIGDFADLLVREQGKPRDRAAGEAAGAMTWFRVTAAYELPVEVVRDDDKGRIEVRRRPIGVVGGITPWNFPLILACWKIAPALLTGNTIVLKPSPYTPLATLVLGELIRDIVPAGVVNIVSGGDDLGRAMTTHPGIDKISFTGSVETGKAIMAAVAPDLKRLTLELGGNDAAIVLPDVDPKEAAPKIFEAAFGNTGQVCSALKRLYVHEDIYEPMCAALADLAKQAKVGPGTEEGVSFGPLNNQMQLDKVISLVEDAKANGARILTGGSRMERPGYFYPLTLVADVTDGMRLVDEEQFGPVLPILRFSDVEDAIERANRVKYGLGGSVWTRDVEHGLELAARLECGTAWVNQHTTILPDVPFGGCKWSGIGRENGRWGLEEYTNLQVFNAVSL